MANRDLIEHFFASFQTINRYVRAGQFDQENQPITRVQWLIMRHLYNRGERSIGQLATHLNVRSSTMSQMIDRLEKAGLVYRSIDRQDGRTRMVRVTDEGLKTIREIEATWVEKMAEPFDSLTPEENETLVHLMKKLTDNLPKREK